MGADVPPLLQGLKARTKIISLHSKRKYRYHYVHIPGPFKGLVEGKVFRAEVVSEKEVVYRISEPSPDTYKPVERNGSLYIRLPIMPEKREAEIEFLPDGFRVIIR